MSWKRWALIITLVVLSLLLISWKTLTAKAIDWYLTSYYHKSLDAGFSAKSFSIDNQKITIKDATLASNYSIEEGGYEFNLGLIEIEYVFHPLSWECDLRIFLDKPVITLNYDTDLHDLIEKYGQRFIFDGRADLAVKNGTLLLHDRKGPHTIHFNTELDLSEYEYARLAVSFDDPDDKKNSFTLSLTKDEKTLYRIDTEFHEVECRLVSEVVKEFYHSLKGWDVQEGKIDGKVTLTKLKGKPLFAEGDARLIDMKIENPLKQMQASIGEMKLRLEGKNGFKKTTVGSLEIVRDCFFSINKRVGSICDITNIRGGVTFDGHDAAKINLTSQCAYDGLKYTLDLDGELRLFEEAQTFGDIFVRMAAPDQEDITARLVVRQLNSEWNNADIELKNIGYQEFYIIQELLAYYDKDFKKLQIYRGIFDASATANLKGSTVHDLKVTSLHTRNFVFEYEPWDLYVRATEISGQASMNLAEKHAFENITADLLIHEGIARISGLDRELWQLSNIETHLKIKNGVIHESLLKADFAGLKGTIELDWTAPDEIMKLKFQGGIKGLSSKLPANVSSWLIKNFSGNEALVLAGVTRHGDALQMKGILEVEGSSNDDIAFGFDIEKSKTDFWGRRKHHASGLNDHELIAIDAIERFLPTVAAPLAKVNSQWIQNEAGIGGVVIRSGWFYGKNLPVNKYMIPFVIDEEDLNRYPLDVKGIGEFRGAFDQSSIAITYNLHDLVIDGEDFTISIDKIFYPEDSYKLNGMSAIHYIDLRRGDYFGLVPIKQGTYREKNTGLEFTNISTKLKIEKDKIHATGIETFCKGAFFAADIDIDLGSPEKGVFDVELFSHAMNGKVSQLQQILSQLREPPAIVGLPVEGNVSFKNKGAYVLFNIRPNDTRIETQVEAVLTDGKMDFSPLDVSLQELKMSVLYNEKENLLDLQDIQGTLIAGKGDTAQEYPFAGERFYFSDYENSLSEFDFWVEGKKEDVLRVVGSTKAIEGQDIDSKYIEVALNEELTHIGSIHPSDFALILKDWTQIHHFNLNVQVPVEALFYDLQHLSLAGISFLPRAFFERVAELKSVKGDLKLNLNYEDATNLFTYNANVIGLDIASFTFDNCILCGKMKDRVWNIDEFRLDDFSLAAEIQRLEKSWKVNFLGLKKGKSLLMGLEGEYVDGQTTFDAKLNLLEINLDKLKEWKLLESFVKDNDPKGNFKAKGDIHFDLGDNKKRWNCDFLAQASLTDGEFRQISFADIQDFSCHIISDQGVFFRNINTSLLTFDANKKAPKIRLERFGYNLADTSMNVEGLSFIVPAESLEWLTQKFKSVFPDVATESLLEPIKNLRQSGDVRGSFTMKLKPEEHFVELRLDENEYTFDNRVHRVKSVQLTHQPNNFNLLSQYSYESHLFWLNVQSLDPEFSKGTMVLSDHKLDSIPEGYEPLKVQWESSPEKGFTCNRAEGCLGGLEVALIRDTSLPLDDQYLHLEGGIRAHLPQACCLMEPELIVKLNTHGIGGVYDLKGRWSICKDEGDSLFSGDVMGHNITLKGYLFSQMNVECSYCTQQALLKNFSIHDPCGEVFSEAIHLDKMEDDTWWMVIPLLQVRSFKPHLLNELEETTPQKVNKTLIITHIDTENIQGNLSDTTTFVGNGKLHFTNYPKVNLKNTIFALPHELLTRLGLNPGVLTPISGSVNYEVKDGRIYLTKFNDVYGEGHASKFYIPKNMKNSYVDFDGNLNLQIRMKHYNLLFKIAESMIVNIRGTLSNPVYSLQNQEKSGSRLRI